MWGAGTRAPGPADGRLQPRWPLLSPSRSRCTSPASVGLYTSGEPLLPGLRRAVNPTPLPGCTRRIDHSGKATFTRANSAAGVRLTRHRPPVSQPARHRGSHGAAHPRQPPRPSRPPPPPAPPSAGRFGADAVILGACLENAHTPRGVTCACCRFFSHGHRPGSTTRQKCAGSMLLWAREFAPDVNRGVSSQIARLCTRASAKPALVRSSTPRCAPPTASSTSPSAPVPGAAWPCYHVTGSAARPCSAWPNSRPHGCKPTTPTRPTATRGC